MGETVRKVRRENCSWDIVYERIIIITLMKKHLIGCWLTIQWFSALSSQWEVWWSTGIRGAGEGLRVLHLEFQ